MVSDHQRNASRHFPVLVQLQTSFPRYVKRLLNLFSQVLLIVTPRKKVWFQFAGPILKNLFLQTNMSESERLAVRNESFTVFGVAAIHANVLVFVHGFDMQVSLNPAVVQVYGCVQECYFLLTRWQ